MGVSRAGQRCVAAGAGAVDTAMVDDDHGAIERGADRVRGVDVRGHVFIAAFGTAYAAVEGIEGDGDRLLLAKLAFDRGNEGAMVAHQVERDRLEEERVQRTSPAMRRN